MSELAGLRALKARDEKIRLLRNALCESESLLEESERNLAATKIKPIVKARKASRRKTKDNARSFIVCLTDNHFTQIVDPAHTNGNGHDESIGKLRFYDAIDQMGQIADGPIDEVLVWLGGDSMVNGDLHPHFRRITPYEPQEEMGVVTEILLNGFNQLLNGPLGNGNVRVHASLSNHGRDCKKEEESAEIAYRRSWDVTIAKTLERLVDVPFHVEKSFFGVEEVGGVKSLLHHGHRLSVKDEPVTGLMVPNWNQLRRRLMQPRLQGCRLLIHGHYHTHCVLHGAEFCYVSVGSTVGQDGYSYELNYPPHVPSQALVEIQGGAVRRVHRICV